MADWGAEVIRVEPINILQPNTRGPLVNLKQSDIDESRTWNRSYPDWTPGEQPYNRFNMYHAHGRNKMSMSMDFTQSKGLELFMELVRVSDIVMENNVPSTIEKLGIDYGDIRTVKPDIVMLRMPGYGLSGPYRDYRTFGQHLDGSAGHTRLRGWPDQDPSFNEDVYWGDAAVAVTAGFAAALAIREVRQTGRGRLLELAQIEALIPFFGEALVDFQTTGRVAQPQGNDLYDLAPHNAYQCAGEDRWIAIAVGNNTQWHGLIHSMAKPSWAYDKRFDNQASRYKHRRELDDLISQWTMQHTGQWLMETLQQHGVPSGVVNNDRDVLRDRHFRDRDFFEEMYHPDTGLSRYPGVVWKMAKTPNKLRFPPARIGQHNDYVYQELLGISAETYTTLRDKRIASDTYQPHVP